MPPSTIAVPASSVVSEPTIETHSLSFSFLEGKFHDSAGALLAYTPPLATDEHGFTLAFIHVKDLLCGG